MRNRYIGTRRETVNRPPACFMVLQSLSGLLIAGLRMLAAMETKETTGTVKKSTPPLTAYAALPVVGMLAVTLPVLVNPGAYRWYDSRLFPIVNTAVEGLAGTAIFLLFLAGAVVGATVRGIRTWLASLAFISLLPAFAFAEMAVDSSSHNLIPFELLIYLMLALVPAAGIGVGKLAATPSPSSSSSSV